MAKQPFYIKKYGDISLPNAEKAHNGGLYLPNNPSLEKEEIDCFVVGEPKNLDGTPTDSTVITKEFVAKLSKKYPHISIKRIDERFTSKIAKQSILDAGIKKMKRRDKALVDKVSAAIILQSYLDANN